MKKRKKNLILINICVIFCVFAFALISYMLYDSKLTQCMFLKALHMYCPGCGGTRAVFALLRLDIVASLIYNPIVILGAIVYVYYNIRAIIAIRKNDEAYFTNQKHILLMILVGFVFVYFIIRNILLFNGIDLIGDVLGKGVI